MDKSAKKYSKALDCYHKGDIEKALRICEECISSNLKNSAALNLKGLLLYIKGDLEGAQALWSINKDVNKDGVSKKYLEDSKKDEERKKLFITASGLIKNVRIKEAVEILRECEKSDFNTINVGNALAACLIKQGKYEEAKFYIDKVLGIDRSSSEALENKKMLMEYGVIKKELKGKKIAAITASAAVVLIILTAGFIKHYGYIKPQSDLKDKKIINEERENKDKVVLPVESSMPKPTSTPKPSASDNNLTSAQVKEEFPSEEINKALEVKNYNALYTYMEYWKSKKLSINDSYLLSKVGEYLKNEGVQAFYQSGMEKLNRKDNTGAKDDLLKAYSYGRDSSLYPHIIYMLAVACQRSNDIENSLKFYEEYVKIYSDGNYAAEANYNLALLYKNIDMKKAKEYAQKISAKYSDTMFNNTNIKDILNR